MFNNHYVKSSWISAKKSFFCALLFLVFMPCLAMAATEPVAMVTDVQGTARLTQDSQITPLTVLTYLAPDSEIELDKGSHVVLTYFTQSIEYTFKGPARIVIQATNAKAITGTGKIRKLDNEKSAPIKTFIQNGRVTQATLVMRSVLPIKPRLQSPLNSKISSTTPTFEWKAIEDADRYQLTLTNDDDVVIHEEFIKTTKWQLPTTNILQYGNVYNWKIVAFMKSGESYPSEKRSFTIADKDTIKRINTRRLTASASFSDKVLYAVYLEAEGFHEAAHSVWQELEKERPDDANLKQQVRH